MNNTPDWAEIKIHPWCKAMSACPYCEKDNSEQFEMRLRESVEIDYYKSAHIPPSIRIDCVKCETEYDVAIEVRILPAGLELDK